MSYLPCWSPSQASATRVPSGEKLGDISYDVTATPCGCGEAVDERRSKYQANPATRIISVVTAANIGHRFLRNPGAAELVRSARIVPTSLRSATQSPQRWPVSRCLRPPALFHQITIPVTAHRHQRQAR